MGKDLLGDPAPETPAMTEPLPWKIFYVSDYEWVVARTEGEAMQCAAAMWGYDSVDAARADEQLDDVGEISEVGLDKMMFCDDSELPEGEMVKRTFREELKIRVDAGLSAPELFACTDY